MDNQLRVIRIKELTQKLSVSKSTIYDWLNENSPRYDPTFPKSVSIGQSCVGWLSTKVDEWLIGKYESQNPSAQSKDI